MAENPLAPPDDPRLLQAFLQRFGLRTDQPPRTLLCAVATAFSQLPYENLTKIIKQAEVGDAARAKRLPAEVLADHGTHGAGGTCFALTATLLHLVRALGWQAEPLLADRRYGPNTHCALAVWIDGRPHLLDPGYLIVEPIPLPNADATRLTTAFNEVVLTPRAGGEKLELATVSQGHNKYRLTFRTTPADAGEFLRAWEASFAWDMMHYPVLTRVVGSQQRYLQGDRFQIRSRTAVARQEVPAAELLDRIAAEFGIARDLAAQALTILHRRGAPYG